MNKAPYAPLVILHAPLVILLLPLAFLGCVSKAYVRDEVASTHARLDDVEGQVEANQTRIDEQGEELDEQGQQIDAVSEAVETASETAKEALDRARQAGKLAKGQLLFETALTDDEVKFAVDQARLASAATAAIDELAGQLIAANESVYIEIQGHTDSTGAEDYNLELGYERAQAVMRYLNRRHGLPLHRMSAVSYGETAPVADNGTREGRSQNRRVVLVVLR